MSVLCKKIIFFGQPCYLYCDGKCTKAWGINSRPMHNKLEDNAEYFKDSELGVAPIDPGTYEGCDGKPLSITVSSDMNKWCARECERSVLLKEEVHDTSVIIKYFAD